LITKGIDAMGVLTERCKRLTITSEPGQPDSVLVSVRDTGIGIGPAAEYIFAPFYTAKSEGMGLSISKAIIEAHGGQLWAKPNVPQGAISQFRLPVAGQEVS
jgi:signal transduction histidine kinase